jgi:WS/DGAT/MGAT family acyltransferase
VTISRWFTESGARDPDDMDTPPLWHGQKPQRPRKGKEPTYADLVAEAIRVFGDGVQTAKDMATLTLRLVQRRFLEGDRDITFPLGAPRTRLNVVPGAARYLTATTFPLNAIRDIAHDQQVSINDVLLTICDLAVNRYFVDKGEPLTEPLVVYMPVNLRGKEDSDAGNMVSLLQVRMSSYHDDCLRALHQVSASSGTAREVFSGFGKPAIQLYALTVALLGLVEETLKLDKVLPPVNNLVVSNIPGPPETLYFRGAESLAAYPISTLPPMTALNVTANSYAGVMHVGLVGARSAIPDLDSLAAHMDDVYAEMKELTIGGDA